MTMIPRCLAACCLTLLVAASPASGQPPVAFVGLGDSIGEGVQSADANEITQQFSFLNLIAHQMGVPFPLPLIRTSPLAWIYDAGGRSRVDPTVRSLNLAVSGADVQSILVDASTATSVAEIDTETELVLFPQVGSQIDLAESLHPQYVACWIGNNDALGAVLAFDHLDASQLTPVSTFAAAFAQLVARLHATGTKAVFATIPDILSIGYLLDGQELIRFLGSDYGLPAGSLTTLPAMALVKLGLASPAIFTDPSYVLDPAEQQVISHHIDQLNAVIAYVVAYYDMTLVDTHGLFGYVAANGLNLFGIDLTTRFLGGIFSLDGVHPSDIGHGLLAYFFIDALNRKYGAGIPQLDLATLYLLTVTDPFIDKDHDGRVTGRPGLGLLETALAVLGISGDPDDTSPAGPTRPGDPGGAGPGLASSRQRTLALDELAKRTGRDLRTMTPAERLQAFHQMFGTGRLAR